MTDDEFRSDLLAACASRAEVVSCSAREGFASEVLERLAEADEIPDTELCSETLNGQRNRKLEVDAWSMDEADDSLHLYVVLYDGSPTISSTLSLTEAREQGFNRLLGVFEQSRDGWLTASIEESRPLWALAKRIQTASLPTALRLHVLTDRPVSERLREIPVGRTSEDLAVTFQIWDLSRLRRIHDARNARDDLIVDFSSLPDGGLSVLPASVGSGDYTGYLTVVPGEVLAEMYTKHGSRLLEGNVRTFLGRTGKVNKGIAITVAKDPAKFFAYNNGIATTAGEVTVAQSSNGSIIITSATDLQIVNGAQTTASLAAALRDGSLKPGTVFVPMKLSVVPQSVSEDLIPLISRFANSQNGVKPSDFFANHAFHRRMEEISRRVLTHAVAGSQIQTHWYYERARGQHLNDQAGLTAAKKNQFLLVNPRSQVIKKTDFAKIECCFNLEPDIASKGPEKAFVSFAERISREWEDEGTRDLYGDDWFRTAVAKIILFKTTERIISEASWYEGGYRAKIAAYTAARLARLGMDESNGGLLDYLRVWSQQSAGELLERQIAAIAEVMARVLRNPPLAGRDISEWAKQQACRKTALDTPVPIAKGFDAFTVSPELKQAARREQKAAGSIERGLDAVKIIMSKDAGYWEALRKFARSKGLLSADDEKSLVPACRMPEMIPTDRQSMRLLQLAERAAAAGWKQN